MAPSPHGPYWEEGMKLGYQDAGSWTLMKSTPLKQRKAAWLYAQFTNCKSVSLKKTLVRNLNTKASGNRTGGFIYPKQFPLLIYFLQTLNAPTCWLSFSASSDNCSALLFTCEQLSAISPADVLTSDISEAISPATVELSDTL